LQTNRYKVIICAGVCITLPLLVGIIEGIRSKESTLESVEIVIKLLFFLLFFSASAYKEEKDSKHQFLKQTKLKKEFKKSKNILNILLPDFVRERIRTGQRFISEDQGVVTIIFIDFMDFDDIVSMNQPGELIDFLDKMYNAYDQMCNIHSLQKIETVGKSYMACGGLKAIEKKYKKNRSIKHHTIRILNFAFEVVEYVKKRNLKNGDPLRVKIGIHTGRVISGVVGQHKPQFSLVGDSVNRTSRVCSKCESNKIHMSEDTQKFLKGLPDLRFEPRTVWMKGLGDVQTFYVYKKKTAIRNKNSKIVNIADVENDEEEKDEEESELFAESDDSRVKRVDNEDNNKNENQDQAASNVNARSGNENFDSSIMINEDGSENGIESQDKSKNKNVIFEIPKYLICIKRKNAKYESYIFKKNVENYKLFFNFSCCLLVLVMGLSELSLFGNGETSEMNTEKTVYLI
jgi:class 3 adenylate cyclase